MAENIYFKDTELYKDDDLFAIYPGGMAVNSFTNKSELTVTHNVSSLAYWPFARVFKGGGPHEFVIPKIDQVTSSSCRFVFDSVVSGDALIIGGEVNTSSSLGSLRTLPDVDNFNGTTLDPSTNLPESFEGYVGVIRSDLTANVLTWVDPAFLETGNASMEVQDFDYSASEGYKTVYHGIGNANYFPFIYDEGQQEYVLPDTSNLTAKSINVRADSNITGKFMVIGGAAPTSGMEMRTLEYTGPGYETFHHNVGTAKFFPFVIDENDKYQLPDTSAITASTINLQFGSAVNGTLYYLGGAISDTGILKQSEVNSFSSGLTMMYEYPTAAIVKEWGIRVREQTGSLTQTATVSIGSDAGASNILAPTDLGLNGLNELYLSHISGMTKVHKSSIQAKIHSPQASGVGASQTLDFILYGHEAI